MPVALGAVVPFDQEKENGSVNGPMPDVQGRAARCARRGWPGGSMSVRSLIAVPPAFPSSPDSDVVVRPQIRQSVAPAAVRFCGFGDVADALKPCVRAGAS